MKNGISSEKINDGRTTWIVQRKEKNRFKEKKNDLKIIFSKDLPNNRLVRKRTKYMENEREFYGQMVSIYF